MFFIQSRTDCRATLRICCCVAIKGNLKPSQWMTWSEFFIGLWCCCCVGCTFCLVLYRVWLSSLFCSIVFVLVHFFSSSSNWVLMGAYDSVAPVLRLWCWSVTFWWCCLFYLVCHNFWVYHVQTRGDIQTGGQIRHVWECEHFFLTVRKAADCTMLVC